MEYVNMESLRRFKARIMALIPTKTSQLTNDAGFITKDKDTTYELIKDSDGITLQDSNGVKSTIPMSQLPSGGGGTYEEATETAGGLMSPADKTKLNSIEEGAQVNQNSFSTIKVGSTTIASGAEEDAVTFEAGNNVTITPDAANKKVTIAAKDTTYSVATQSANGLQSAADKTKLDGIAAGAQVNSVTGVKGNAEKSYRTGQINITPANIGLGSVNNTADSAKSVASAKAILDSGDSRNVTVGRSKANLSSADTLAAWSGNELRTVAIKTILLAAHPVGSIYVSYTSTSPATLFGGTWTRIKGQFLLAADDSTYKAGATGGEAEHTLTVDEMPSHAHSFTAKATPWISKTGYGSVNVGSTTADNKANIAGQGEDTNVNGGGQPHNNMPPYLAVYMWRRTA